MLAILGLPWGLLDSSGVFVYIWSAVLKMTFNIHGQNLSPRIPCSTLRAPDLVSLPF